MKIIKRDGHVVDYCPEKIEIAIKENPDNKINAFNIFSN